MIKADFELWKDVLGYEGYYKVSTWGRVISLRYNGTFRKKPKLMKIKTCDKRGYYYISLYKDGERMIKRVHRIVAETFIANPLGFPQVNHMDENCKNNNRYNLEWCTNKYNASYGDRGKRIGLSNGRNIYQYTLDKKFIKKWDTIHQVEEVLGFKNACIGQCARGNVKTSYGYIWSFTPLHNESLD